MREALVALCNDNVLRSIPRYGYEVVRLSRQDIDEMPELRYLIEGGMIPANLDNINAKQIKQLELLNETCSISNDVWSHWESNVNSHLQLMAFCRNEFAYLELRRALNRRKIAYTQFYRSKWDPDAAPADTKNHTEIIESLAQRNSEKLLKALRKDLLDFESMNPASISEDINSDHRIHDFFGNGF